MAKVLLALFLALASSTFAQVGPDRYWIEFTDKVNTPYSISQPLEFLSQRALDRRTLHDVPVTLQDIPPNDTYIDSILNSGVSRVICASRWMNGMMLFSTDSAFVDTLSNFSFVSQVKALNANAKGPSKIEKFEDNLTKCDDLTTYYDDYYGLSYLQTHMLNGHWLHDDGYSGEGMQIAVIDAGFTNAHEIEAHKVLFDEKRVLGEKDVIDNGSWVFANSSHGTYVLSTMAANVPGTMVGTAPNASYYLLRTEDASREYMMEEYAWLCAAEYADSAGVDVINSSLGYTQFDDATQNHVYADLDGNTTIVTRAADIAASKGMICVVSAGNSGQSPWYYLSAPSDADSVLAIGAVDSFSVSAAFSSHGPAADGRVKPDVSTMGMRAYVAAPNDGFYFAGNGTSFASPIAAGLVACLWQAHPDRTNMEIIEAVRKSGSIYSAPDTDLGYGIPDFYLAHLMLLGEPETSTEDRFLRAYPNPIEDRIRLLFYATSDENALIEVYDPTGRLIYDALSAVSENQYCDIRIETDVLDWAQGTYTIRITTSSGSYTQRMVKAD
jgi:serine protease AprX